MRRVETREPYLGRWARVGLALAGGGRHSWSWCVVQGRCRRGKSGRHSFRGEPGKGGTPLEEESGTQLLLLRFASVKEMYGAPINLRTHLVDARPKFHAWPPVAMAWGGTEED